MNEIIAMLSGKKTYITALAGIGATLAMRYGYIDISNYYDLCMGLAFLLAIFLRGALKHLAPEQAVDIPTPTIDTTQPVPTNVDIEALLKGLAELITPAAKEKK